MTATDNTVLTAMPFFAALRENSEDQCDVFACAALFPVRLMRVLSVDYAKANARLADAVVSRIVIYLGLMPSTSADCARQTPSKLDPQTKLLYHKNTKK